MSFQRSLRTLRHPYNFMRIHNTLRMTPAMQAGIANDIWTWQDILPYEAN